MDQASERRAFSVSVFLVNRETKCVLLVLHKRLDKWLPVGGEVEILAFAEEEAKDIFIETPQEAVLREACEETGLSQYDVEFVADGSAPVGTPAGYLGYEEHQAGSKGLHMNFVFWAYMPNKEVKSDGSWTQRIWADLKFHKPGKYLPVDPEKTPRNVIQYLTMLKEILGKSVPKRVVHILYEGQSLCDMSKLHGVHGTWPAGNVWIGVEEQRAVKSLLEEHQATCTGCLHTYGFSSLRTSPLTTCKASRGDGECFARECPQLRDGEPGKSGRHCPLDKLEDDDKGTTT